MQEVLGHLPEQGSIAGIESKLMMFAERQKVLDAGKYKRTGEEVRMNAPATASGPATARGPATTPRTFIRQGLGRPRHREARYGDADLLQIDRLVLHELSGSQAVRALAEAGR